MESAVTGKNSGSSKNPTGRRGKTPDDIRGNDKQTSFNDTELERVDWARKELGLDYSSYLRYAALKVAREVIG